MMWLRLCLASLLCVVSVVRSQSQSCTGSAFPNATSIKTFLDGTASGSKEHLRYVAKLFQEMSIAESNCSASSTGTRSSFTIIPDPVFADGLQSRLFEQQEVFSVSNAQVLNNLLISSPPTAKTASAGKQSYCFAEDSAGQCTDCNVWDNNLYFDSHLKATLEARDDATAVGTCLKTGTSTLECREASAVAGKNITMSTRSNVNTASCSEPWLWQKPLEVFNTQMANGGFDKSYPTNIVSGNYQADQTVRYVTRNTSAWSNVMSQCYNNGRSEWVHIHTVPVIAVCNTRLVAAQLCTTPNIGNVVMVGSAWTAFSLRSAYNLTQCPSRVSGAAQNDVFVGSATCGQARVAGNQSEALECVDRPSGFQRNSYECACPGARHLVEPLAGATVVLPEGRALYTGSHIASHVGNDVQQISVSTCVACQPGCRSCIDGSACLRKDNSSLRVPILIINVIILVMIIVLVVFIQGSLRTTIMQSAAPSYLMAILIGSVIASLESFILFAPLNDAVCALQPWPRHLAFTIMFAFLFGKLWRVQVLARLPPGRIQICELDRGIQRFVGIVLGAMTLYLILWSAINRSTVEIAYDDLDRSYSRCTVDYWRYAVHGVEFAFLLLGCLVAQLTRRLVLEWTEFKFLLGAFANAAVIKGLIAVFYFTLMPNKYSDYLYLLQFFDNFFTVNLSLIILFGHKVYMMVRKKDDRGIGPTVPTKLQRKESNQDMSAVQEVALQQLAESDPASKKPAIPIGIFDVMCGCFGGSIHSEWSTDYYGAKEKKKGAGSQMPNVDESAPAAAVAKGSGDDADSGMPYMGDNDQN